MAKLITNVTVIDATGRPAQPDMTVVVLQNIANTRKIHAVIIGGKLITQNQRQEMLAKIESFARQH